MNKSKVNNTSNYVIKAQGGYYVDVNIRSSVDTNPKFYLESEEIEPILNQTSIFGFKFGYTYKTSAQHMTKQSATALKNLITSKTGINTLIVVKA